eukprot:symbB.v1.2.019978.t1/scaffold1654.1/size107508/3
MRNMFSFEEALVVASGSGTGSTGTRLFQTLTECASKKRMPGDPEPLVNVRLSQSALSVDTSCSICAG